MNILSGYSYFYFLFHLSVGPFFYIVFSQVFFCGFVYLLLLLTISLLAAGHPGNYLNVPCAQKTKYINTSTSLTSTEQTEFSEPKIHTVSHSNDLYFNATCARNGLQMKNTQKLFWLFLASSIFANLYFPATIRW